MRSPGPRRIALVPVGGHERVATGPRKVRRYALARVAVSPRSALGVDRHERLENVVAAERSGLNSRP
jgi:hypothetical protein